MRRFWIVPSALLLIVLSACAGAATKPFLPNVPEAATSKPPNMLSTPTPEVAVIAPPATDESAIVPRPLTEKVKAHLASRLNINITEIRVIEALAVSWPDTSLGCPQPGLAYAQVITPGYRIILEAKGEQYPYHTDMGGHFLLCMANKSGPNTETPPLPLLPVNPTEIQDGQPWMPVN